MRTLPYDTGWFTGRSPELRSLGDGALAVGETGRTSVFAIEGMGGVGKTALAVHAAHQVTGEFPDLFPDGHLFLDLHGYTPGVSALTANEALRSLLRQLGVPHEVIPAKQVPREALYRSTLAGKKALLILDNAKDAAQVRPLLPGTAACLVIVTSRETLRSLDGLTVLRLETPPEAEAVALFRKVAGPQAGPDDAELPADPELAELGIAQRMAGATADSHASLTEALGIYQRLGDRLGEAAALNELGSVRWQTGPISEAERHVLGALRIFRGLGNRQGQAAALLYLGNVQLTMRALAEAEASFREAGAIGVRLRHPVLVANSLLYLGDVQRVAGQLGAARESLESAHKIYTRISHRQGRATSLAYLGRTLSLAGDYSEADARLAAALALFDELDDPSDKAEVLNARGSVAHAVGDSAAARGYREEALRLATTADSGREQGAALLGLAVLDAEADERDAALARTRAALALYMAMENDEGITGAREILCRLREPG